MNAPGTNVFEGFHYFHLVASAIIHYIYIRFLTKEGKKNAYPLHSCTSASRGPR